MLKLKHIASFGAVSVIMVASLVGCAKSYQSEETARREVAAQEELRKSQVAEDAAANAELKDEKRGRR